MKHSVRTMLTLAMRLIFWISIPCNAGWVGDARPLMGTEVSVYLWHEDEAEGLRLAEAVFTETGTWNCRGFPGSHFPESLEKTSSGTTRGEG